MVIFTGPKESLKPHVVNYIETYKFVAIDEMVRSGIPASIITVSYTHLDVYKRQES